MKGDRLKALRKAKKLNQEELAAIIGVKKSTVSLYETDNSDPSDGVKIEIAKYFNVSLDYLLGLINEPLPYYNDSLFLKLPDNLTVDEKKLIYNIVDYIEYNRKHPSYIDWS